MLKKPALNSGYTNETTPEDFPAGRSIQAPAPAPAEHTLTANMTGQVLLTGGEFDLQFNKGSLKRISRNNTILFDKLNSRTRFKTTKGTIEYRNESAFSFEGENEYGLRTLQVPKKRKRYDCRVITDYTFTRKSNEVFITVTVDYPKFGRKSIVKEASVFEFRLMNCSPEGINISSESSASQSIKPENSSIMKIEGRLFEIKNGEKTLFLTFPQKDNSDSLSRLRTLSVKAATIGGKSILFINPGGSYTPVPGKYYSEAREQFCFSIRID